MIRTSVSGSCTILLKLWHFSPKGQLITMEAIQIQIPVASTILSIWSHFYYNRNLVGVVYFWNFRTLHTLLVSPWGGGLLNSVVFWSNTMCLIESIRGLAGLKLDHINCQDRYSDKRKLVSHKSKARKSYNNSK